MSEALLDVRDLRTHFHTDDGVVRAVEGVSFSLARGEALGIVGESGSGKSVTNLTLMGLIPTPPGEIVSGEALFEGRDLLHLPRGELRAIRGRRIAMIFQDPMTCLNPFLTIGRQMTEGMETHLGLSSEESRTEAIRWLERVGIPRPGERLASYPHQFSGGMRQRVMIAMALSCKPDLLIADEPTTALDVTIQAQILDLLRTLQRELGMALILITHNLGVVAGTCSRVLVMYAGRIVEQAPVGELFAHPRHPYTIGLLKSVPRLDETRKVKLLPIEGHPPDLAHPLPGCSFEPRCPYRVAECRVGTPPLRSVGEGRLAACIRDMEGGRP
ncbi:MAG: ABC transporter ATP-binding protein [Planctomycetales bacterium]|nr:ABC transporter ATP-binding protein [Planctomycetales bacterium]